tara:strand:+ start:317 stop:511 length:195 start_codon:yes stop_codon:yes gene_type:complete
MCLGGGQPDYSQRPNIQKYNPPPGPASPPDMVNDMEIKKTGDFSRKPKAETKTTNRSSLNTGMY